MREALALCRKTGAVLIIAKLDRLARNVHFVSGLLEAGVEFVAADMPHANKVMIQMHAVMSEWVRDQISTRTKAALQAAKNRGVKLGITGPANLKPNIEARKQAADAFALRLSAVIQGFKASGMTGNEGLTPIFLAETRRACPDNVRTYKMRLPTTWRASDER